MRHEKSKKTHSGPYLPIFQTIYFLGPLSTKNVRFSCVPLHPPDFSAQYDITRFVLIWHINSNNVPYGCKSDNVILCEKIWRMQWDARKMNLLCGKRFQKIKQLKNGQIRPKMFVLYYLCASCGSHIHVFNMKMCIS